MPYSTNNKGFQPPPPGSVINWSHPLAPKEAWLLNEKSGQRVQNIATRSHGTIQDTVDWSSGFLALGGSTYIDMTNDPLLYCGTKLGWSVSYWVYQEAFTGSEQTHWSRSGFANGPYMSEFTNGRLGVWYGSTFSGTNSAISTQKWHHMVLTCTLDGLLHFYVDGVEIPKSSSGTHSPQAATSNMLIGRQPGFGQFSGKISTFLFYERALTETEIKRLREKPFCMLKTPGEYIRLPGLITYFAPSPVLTSAIVDATGTTITLSFDKDMADPSGKHAEFTFEEDSVARTFSAAALGGSDEIVLTVVGAPITRGSTVTVSYTAGTVKGSDTSTLDSFVDEAVVNNSEFTARGLIRPGEIFVARIEMDHDTILTSGTKGIEIIPARTSGMIIQPLSLSITAKIDTAYTASGGSGKYKLFADAAATVTTLGSIETDVDLIESTGEFATVALPVTVGILDASTLENLGVYLKYDVTSLTGGASTNKLQVVVTYTVIRAASIL